MSTPVEPSLGSRRRFIALAGGGAVAIATPLAGCSSAYPAAALAPWRSADLDHTDLRRFMLAHALLAPNPHNRQPWLADLRRPDEITLRCDPSRLLPQTDPFGRQILIGCGAFIELAVIAAAERGVRVQVQPFPEGEPAPHALPGAQAVATLRLAPQPGLPRDPLFAQIRRRHTHKGAYDKQRALTPAQWEMLTVAASLESLQAGTVVDAARRQQLREITRAAYEVEISTARTWLESAHLLRIGPDEIERHRDGIALNTVAPRIASALGLFDRFEVPVRGSANFKRAMDRWPPFETGSGYLWIAARGPGRCAQLDSGRAYVRAHLAATAAGIDMHPLSQALQEFAEVREQHAELHRLLGLDPAQTPLQMLARMGFGLQAAGPTPRRALDPMMQV
jgi:hypothetical protein